MILSLFAICWLAIGTGLRAVAPCWDVYEFREFVLTVQQIWSARRWLHGRPVVSLHEGGS